MTKSAAPLIIIMVYGEGRSQGCGQDPPIAFVGGEETQMRVQIHKTRAGVYTYTVVPARRTHMSPVTLRGTDEQVVRDEVAAVIALVSGAELAIRDGPTP